MKYVKPHLSPELRAQITPHSRKDLRFTAAGVFFLLVSAGLFYNLWPKQNQSTNNNKATIAITQSGKQVLGANTSSVPSTQPTSNAQFTEYTVKNGDTLFNISQKYNVRWDSIASINNLSEPYVLHGGQTLKIPQATTSKIPDKIYTIKDGETLVDIAKQFNITVDDIIAVNPNLQKSDLITAGQVIKLP
ncbi:MAG: LysM peptidoglycan-binding domain-containing protein [Candidatus Doudnabacteria bacterium]|nr:LysM peptidoglycan-binding domain-containing protein [Candidatus Doudnabacteria bacterium]